MEPSRAKNSGKTHDPRRPTHRVDDPCPSTRPGYRPEPEPIPSTVSRHQTTTLHPHTRGGTDTSADASPPEEPDTPEVSIMWVLPSSARFTSLQLTLPLVDSVMGATGSGKSTVRSFPLPYLPDYREALSFAFTTFAVHQPRQRVQFRSWQNTAILHKHCTSSGGA
jgi:hypothetical protein